MKEGLILNDLVVIKPAQNLTIITYERFFANSSVPGAGYGFECDEVGNIVSFASADAEKNYIKLVSNQMQGGPYNDMGVIRYKRYIKEPAVVQCACKNQFILAGWKDIARCPGCSTYYTTQGNIITPFISEWAV